MALSEKVKPTDERYFGLTSAVKALKGVTWALVGVGQALRAARRGVQREKGREKDSRGMRKCIVRLRLFYKKKFGGEEFWV